ncbi:MAG: 50S ribosomal protein L13 [Candidatus Marinimicrobia bacterium]|nr:50S ribosomal protein L13 [Candidatus Neomarinimicrobiota bacterium]
MSTYSLKAKDIEKNWFVVDAEGQVLGRLATQVATILRGKHKPTFSPHLDMGDCVVVINAEKVVATGNKETGKSYWHHTGYIGGQKTRSLGQMRQTHPDRIITQAVKGMLPHNILGRKILRHLKVYAGPTHPHTAQLPKELEIT